MARDSADACMDAWRACYDVTTVKWRSNFFYFEFHYESYVIQIARVLRILVLVQMDCSRRTTIAVIECSLLPIGMRPAACMSAGRERFLGSWIDVR